MPGPILNTGPSLRQVYLKAKARIKAEKKATKSKSVAATHRAPTGHDVRQLGYRPCWSAWRSNVDFGWLIELATKRPLWRRRSQRCKFSQTGCVGKQMVRERETSPF